MALTAIGVEFERIRLAQGEAAALAFLAGIEPNNAGPTSVAVGQPDVIAPTTSDPNRLIRLRELQHWVNHFSARITDTQNATRAAFNALLRRLGA